MKEIFERALQLEKIIQSHAGVLDTVVFGTNYKAYLFKGKYVMCACEKKSVQNKIAIYKKYFEKSDRKNYYDYVQHKTYEYPTLEEFLGLPSQLEIDFNKDVLSQITFEEYLCHDCVHKKYRFNLDGVDKSANIRRQNYLLSKGVMYMPNSQDCYFLLDQLSEQDIESLVPEFSDFLIKDEIYVNTGIYDIDIIPNPNKKEQIKQVKKFLSLDKRDIVQVLYGNETFDDVEDFLYKQKRIKREYLVVVSGIEYPSKMQPIVPEYIKNVSRRFRQLCTRLYEDYKFTQGKNKYSEQYRKILDEYVDESAFENNKNIDVGIYVSLINPKFFKVDDELIEFVKMRLQSDNSSDFRINYRGHLIKPIFQLLLAVKDSSLLEKFIKDADDEFCYDMSDLIYELYSTDNENKNFYARVYNMLVGSDDIEIDEGYLTIDLEGGLLN